MKKLITLMIAMVAFLATTSLFALPNFWYSGVAYTSGGALITSTNMDVKVTINDGTNTFTETHSTVPVDAFGVFAINVGTVSGPITGVVMTATTKITMEITTVGGSSWTKVVGKILSGSFGSQAKEVDPLFAASAASDIIDGTGFLKNTAGTWSYDNSTYLTSYTETDPVVKAINGIVKSNGSLISAAVAGTDYLAPFAAQAANTVFAGPTTGLNAVPAFRTLVDADIPALSIAKTTGLQTALDSKVDENTAIIGDTKTKITYDSKGLVTAGADATTADIAPSTDRNYVTDAQLVVIGNTSNTNTGDVTVTGQDYIGISGQVITASPIDLATENVDGTLPVANGGTGLTALGTDGQLLRVNTGATALEYFTPSYISGNQTITLTGAVTGSGTTSIATTLGQMGATLNQILSWDGTAWTPIDDTSPSYTAGTGIDISIGNEISAEFGTTAGTVAEGNHLHTGVYEPADATILKDADIGVNVQAYDAQLTAIAGLADAAGWLYNDGSGNFSYSTPTKSDVGLGNVPNVDATNPANIVQSASYRFVTDTEKSTWNGKQDALGFTPENVANKVTSISGLSTDVEYPSAKLLYDQLALKSDATHNHDASYAPLSHVGAVGTAHGVADGTNAGFMSSADYTKLSGITGSNSGDVTLGTPASGLGLSGQVLTLDLVTTTTDGAMSSTDKTKLDGIEALAEVNNISDVNATDLTDGGESTLHYHASDRDRANHTGTQTASTISDFQTAVSANSDVTANTAARHTHANKTILDGIDATDISNWDAAFTHVTTDEIETAADVNAIETDQVFVAHTAYDIAVGTGLLKNDGAGNWTYDNSTYLTANQSITLSGDITGTGATAITTAISQKGASSGQVLKWDGDSWEPANDNNTGTTYSAGTGLSLTGTTFANTAPMVYPTSDGIAVVSGGVWGTSITDNSANWNTAYTHSTNDVILTASDVNDAESDPVWLLSKNTNATTITPAWTFSSSVDVEGGLSVKGSNFTVVDGSDNPLFGVRTGTSTVESFWFTKIYTGSETPSSLSGVPGDLYVANDLEVDGTIYGNLTGNVTGDVTGNAGTVTNGVYTSRQILTTAPLSGGGNLGADLTLSIPAANGSTNGYLTSTDWTDFDSKQDGDADLTGMAALNSTTTANQLVASSGTANGYSLLTAPSTAGQLLTYNGTSVTWAAPAGETLAIITADPTTWDDDVYLVNNSADLTLTLPSASGIAGYKLTIKKISAGGPTREVILDPDGTETIDGATTITWQTQYQGYVIMSDGTNWVIIGTF